MRDDYLPTERVALISWYLAEGKTMTSGQVQGLVGISKQGVWRMMQKIARVRPIVNYNGEWMSAQMAQARHDA